MAPRRKRLPAVVGAPTLAAHGPYVRRGVTTHFCTSFEFAGMILGRSKEIVIQISEYMYIYHQKQVSAYPLPPPFLLFEGYIYLAFDVIFETAVVTGPRGAVVGLGGSRGIC